MNEEGINDAGLTRHRASKASHRTLVGLREHASTSRQRRTLKGLKPPSTLLHRFINILQSIDAERPSAAAAPPGGSFRAPKREAAHVI